MTWNAIVLLVSLAELAGLLVYYRRALTLSPVPYDAPQLQPFGEDS
jgi:hypothetical protein